MALRRKRRAKKQRQREVREAAKRLDQERLSKAAGIVRVDLICHRDTWGFIEGWTFPVGEIGPPPEQATLIKVPLYGPELVRIMTAMRFTGDKIASERAMASRVYDAIIEVIDRVDPADRFVLPHIVIDDGRPR